MHAPGGGNYYAALWTNDQCEYANPFFPFSGYSSGIEQSINCYSLYEKYMDKSDKSMAQKRALADSIGDRAHKTVWIKEQKSLKAAIENYFGANVEGFDTYRYYDGNADLRSWICMPLTVEIFDRADETVNALFSDKLYYDGMMRSTSAHDTTWDRSLLFALRGTFLASKAEKGINETISYCKNRLLGSHGPYPYEAYPEGNRAHLAAESLLFARVITEGLFGLKAVGLSKLRIKPQLSEQCHEMVLKNIKLFSKCFDIKADKNGITVIYDNSNYHTDSQNSVFCFDTCTFMQEETSACPD